MSPKEFDELVTPDVPCKYGAPMGRRDVNTLGKDEEIPKMYCRQIRMVAQGYDCGGAYWGVGNIIYAHYSKCGKIIQYRNYKK